MTHTIITIAQTVLAVLLIITILLQQRGSGISATFGGSGNTYATRRGFERIIFISTIVIALLFFVASVARMLI